MLLGVSEIKGLSKPIAVMDSPSHYGIDSCRDGRFAIVHPDCGPFRLGQSSGMEQVRADDIAWVEQFSSEAKSMPLLLPWDGAPAPADENIK
jgi:hypothetical protein